MELDLQTLTSKHCEYLNYIIPIWNWSITTVPVPLASPFITLFLYGIGAITGYQHIELEHIITLFLYGIGAFHISSQTVSILNITLFLYGIGAVSILFVILFTTSITLFLYGIGALFLPQETYLLTITLFLYGIGANLMVLCFLFCSLLHYSYMELELFLLFSIFKFHSYYIIPIWNWS